MREVYVSLHVRQRARILRRAAVRGSRGVSTLFGDQHYTHRRIAGAVLIDTSSIPDTKAVTAKNNSAPR